ncbi:MAG: HEPN domain-containing protein [bacterium]
MKDITKHRLESAEASLKAAEILSNGNSKLEFVMNRLYYAMFYAASGLLEEKGFVSSKHSRVILLRAMLKCTTYAIKSAPHNRTMINYPARRIYHDYTGGIQYGAHA